MSSALVVIDVQNHFAVEKAAVLPKKIVQHIKKSPYDHVLFTLYRNDPSSNFHKILKYKVATESPAIDIHPLLAPFSNKDNTFEKLTYSAFKIQQFKKFLEDNAITDLYLCGINIDGCVLATAYEAFDLGYNVKILEDLSSVASFRQDYEDSAKTIIARNLKRKPPKTAYDSITWKKQYRYSPIKNIEDMYNAISYIHMACNELCKRNLGEYLPNLGNLVIFCHYEDEYKFLKDKLKELTLWDKNIDNKYYLLKSPISIVSNDEIPDTTIKYLYIRQPDPWRPQVGDLDVYMEPEKYHKLKEELARSESKLGIRVFPRDDLDMIELYDPDVDVLAYIRPEKL